MLIGYARVSTQDQNLDLQHEALKQAGCEKLYEDKISGLRADKPGLEQALEQLREGDTFVVWKLDRLGRSVKNLIEFTNQLEKNVNVWRIAYSLRSVKMLRLAKELSSHVIGLFS